MEELAPNEKSGLIIGFTVTAKVVPVTQPAVVGVNA
jgi:hypothetical protein